MSKPDDIVDETAPPPPAHRPAPRRGRLWAFRAVAAGMGLLFALVIVEAAVRLILAARPNDIETLRRFDHRKQQGGPMTLINFVRVSDNPRLIYELIPNAEGIFRGNPVKFNSAGFFDRDREVAKPAKTFRLAAIGDSVVFGWGVTAEVRFTDVLERYLNETASDGWRFEVLNFGVPGYNTVMEAEQLRSRVMAYGPDAVVLTFVLDNDAALPNFLSRPRPLLTLTRSFAWEIVRQRYDAARALEPGLVGVAPDQLPPEFAFLHGWDNCRAALRDIRSQCARAGIPALFLVDYWNVERWRGPQAVPRSDNPAAEIMAFAAAQNWRVIDMLGPMLDYLEPRGWHSFALCAAPDDSDAHPNAIRHALMARAIHADLLDAGILPDSAHRRERGAMLEARWDETLRAAEAAAAVPDKWKTR
jgi:lysophospholipase L1-like esterase